MKLLCVAILALFLTGCTAADIAVNASKLTWCQVDEVGYLAEVDDHDIHFVLELAGVDCE